MRAVRCVSILAISTLAACSLDEAEMREQAQGGGKVAEAAGDPPELLAADADIRACETYIRAGLESPSSYKRLSVTRRDRPITIDAYADMLGELGTSRAIRANLEIRARYGKLVLRDVTINSVGDDFAGSRTRRTDTCRFALFGGRVTEADDVDGDVQTAIGRRQMRQMARDGMLAGVGPDDVAPEAEAACCLPGDAYLPVAEAAR